MGTMFIKSEYVHYDRFPKICKSTGWSAKIWLWRSTSSSALSLTPRGKKLSLNGFLVKQVFLHEVTVRLWIVPIKPYILIKVPHWLDLKNLGSLSTISLQKLKLDYFLSQVPMFERHWLIFPSKSQKQLSTFDLVFNFNNFHLFILRFNLYLLYGIDEFLSSENDLISKKGVQTSRACYNG